MFCWLVVVLVGWQLDSGGKGRRQSTAEGCFPPTQSLSCPSLLYWANVATLHNPPTQMWPLLAATLERNLYSHVFWWSTDVGFVYFQS